jgi:hypothetical protein
MSRKLGLLIPVFGSAYTDGSISKSKSLKGGDGPVEKIILPTVQINSNLFKPDNFNI